MGSQGLTVVAPQDALFGGGGEEATEHHQVLVRHPWVQRQHGLQDRRGPACRIRGQDRDQGRTAGGSNLPSSLIHSRPSSSSRCSPKAFSSGVNCRRAF